MAWQNLTEDLAELFGEHGVDKEEAHFRRWKKIRAYFNAYRKRKYEEDRVLIRILRKSRKPIVIEPIGRPAELERRIMCTSALGGRHSRGGRKKKCASST